MSGIDCVTWHYLQYALQQNYYKGMIIFFTILDQTVLLKAQAVFIQRLCLRNVKQIISLYVVMSLIKNVQETTSVQTYIYQN